MKRPRGRPKGSRNKKRLAPPSVEALNDYKVADPLTLISRQFSMIDWAQAALRNEMTRDMQGQGVFISDSDIDRLVGLGNALARSVDALRKAHNALEALKGATTPAELFEAALQKIEAQDLATINYAIRRLRAFRQKVAPISGQDKMQLGEAGGGAVGALASLGDE